MLANNHIFRAVIYCAAVVAQVASYFVRAADPGGAWADAVQDTANFLGAMAGVTAMGNLSTSSAARPVRWLRRRLAVRRERRELARRV